MQSLNIGWSNAFEIVAAKASCGFSAYELSQWIVEGRLLSQVEPGAIIFIKIDLKLIWLKSNPLSAKPQISDDRQNFRS